MFFQVYFDIVYIYVPTVSKAQHHPKRVCRIQLFWSDMAEGNCLNGLNIIKYIFGEVSEVVSRMNKAVGHKYLLRIKTVHC